MTTLAIEIDKERLRDFCRRWKITEFALFGSVLRPEEFQPDSDVDVLVRFSEDARWTFFDLVEAEEDLARILLRQVDLVEREAVEGSDNRFRKRSILGSAVLLDVA
jgi:predicted nucleotidyltransferase